MFPHDQEGGRAFAVVRPDGYQRPIPVRAQIDRVRRKFNAAAKDFVDVVSKAVRYPANHLPGARL